MGESTYTASQSERKDPYVHIGTHMLEILFQNCSKIVVRGPNLLFRGFKARLQGTPNLSLQDMTNRILLSINYKALLIY